MNYTAQEYQAIYGYALRWQPNSIPSYYNSDSDSEEESEEDDYDSEEGISNEQRKANNKLNYKKMKDEEKVDGIYGDSDESDYDSDIEYDI
jgi:hypothetical protein